MKKFWFELSLSWWIFKKSIKPRIAKILGLSQCLVCGKLIRRKPDEMLFCCGEHWELYVEAMEQEFDARKEDDYYDHPFQGDFDC